MSREAIKKKRTNYGPLPPHEALPLARALVEERKEEKESERKKAPRLFHMPQTLVIAAGHEGSGKSRITKNLENRVRNIVVVDKDTMTDLYSTGRDDEPVHKATRDDAYALAYQLAEEELAKGNSVVLDGPFNKYEDFFHNTKWVSLLSDIVVRYRAEVKVVWCEAHPTVKLKRIQNRDAERDKHRPLQRLEELAKRVDRPEIVFPHRFHNTERSDKEHLTDEITAFLSLEEEKAEKPQDLVFPPLARD